MEVIKGIILKLLKANKKLTKSELKEGIDFYEHIALSDNELMSILQEMHLKGVIEFSLDSVALVS